MHFLSIFITFIFSTSILLGGEATTTPTTKTGYFVGGATSGLTYLCDNGQGGKTSTNGAFTYDNSSCSKITFKINTVTLGTITSAAIPSDTKLYVTDFVGVERNNTTNKKAQNITRLLQSLDSNQNPKDGIEIIDTNITINTTITDTTNETDLTNILQKQYPSRTLLSLTCALVYLEEVLRDTEKLSVDSVPPCQPILLAPKAITNNTTYVDIIGEKNSKIFLDGIDTNKTLDLNGKYFDFKLTTKIMRNKKDSYLFTLKDSTEKISSDLNLTLFNDTDQPYFVDFASLRDQNLTLPSNTTIASPITVADDSVTSGGLSLTYELLGDHKDLFEIDSSKNLRFRSPATAGIYNLQVKVKDEANHYDYRNFTITVTP